MTQYVTPLSFSPDPTGAADSSWLSDLSRWLQMIPQMYGLGTAAAGGAAAGLATGGEALMGAIAPAFGAGLLPGLGALGAAAAPWALAAAPLFPMLMDQLNDPNGKRQMAVNDFQDAVKAFRSGVPLRTLGAKQLSGLGGLMDDPSIANSLSLAALGLDQPDLNTAVQRISHGTGYGVKGHPEVTAAYEAKAPELSAENWQGYLDLMDAASKRGFDVTPTLSQTKPEDWESQLGATISSPWEAPRFKAPNSVLNPMDLNMAIGEAERYFKMPQGATTTPGGSLADVALGRGGTGTFSPEQLTQMGFTPGNYHQAMGKYLTGLDPTLSNNPLYQQWIGPQVAEPTGITPDQIAANEAGMGQQMTDWSQELGHQQDLWNQQWQRDAALRQQAWTSGGG